MRSKNDGGAQERYRKASAVLDCMYLLLFVANLLLKKLDFWDSAFYMTAVSLIFAAASGCVACLHRKLSKDQREKPNWISASCFGVHPYFTFALFCAFSVIGLRYLCNILP